MCCSVPMHSNISHDLLLCGWNAWDHTCIKCTHGYTHNHKLLKSLNTGHLPQLLPVVTVGVNLAPVLGLDQKTQRHFYTQTKVWVGRTHNMHPSILWLFYHQKLFVGMLTTIWTLNIWIFFVYWILHCYKITARWNEHMQLFHLKGSG